MKYPKKVDKVVTDTFIKLNTLEMLEIKTDRWRTKKIENLT